MTLHEYRATLGLCGFVWIFFWDGGKKGIEVTVRQVGRVSRVTKSTNGQTDCRVIGLEVNGRDVRVDCCMQVAIGVCVTSIQ